MASHPLVAGADRPAVISRPAHQAFELLRLGFAVIPIAAGLDKFFNLFVPWDQYLAPPVTQAVLGITSPGVFLNIIGIFEVALGILVAVRPQIGAYIVTLWLVSIVLNLLLLGQHYDIVLQDLGLAAGALALGRLGEDQDRAQAGIDRRPGLQTRRT